MMFECFILLIGTSQEWDWILSQPILRYSLQKGCNVGLWGTRFFGREVGAQIVTQVFASSQQQKVTNIHQSAQYPHAANKKTGCFFCIILERFTAGFRPGPWFPWFSHLPNRLFLGGHVSRSQGCSNIEVNDETNLRGKSTLGLACVAGNLTFHFDYCGKPHPLIATLGIVCNWVYLIMVH